MKKKQKITAKCPNVTESSQQEIYFAARNKRRGWWKNVIKGAYSGFVGGVQVIGIVLLILLCLFVLTVGVTGIQTIVFKKDLNDMIWEEVNKIPPRVETQYLYRDVPVYYTNTVYGSNLCVWLTNYYGKELNFTNTIIITNPYPKFYIYEDGYWRLK